MMIVSQFRQLNLSVVNVRTYLFAVLFVGGNMLLPQLCHLMPDGGKIFLPIYFFTLIASYKFGLKVGILTAVLSPLCNHLLFGMPPAGMLPVLLVKSTLLALVGAIVADRSQRVSLLHVAAVVVAYQVLGGIAEWLIASDLSAPTLSFPVHGTLMVEPTESEPKEELDRFIEALKTIREEMCEVAEGKADKTDNVLKNAPHTHKVLTADEWTHTYPRSKAAYPLPWVAENKFWPQVGRVDDGYGDRNLMCTCDPLYDYVNDEN